MYVFFKLSYLFLRVVYFFRQALNEEDENELEIEINRFEFMSVTPFLTTSTCYISFFISIDTTTFSMLMEFVKVWNFV